MRSSGPEVIQVTERRRSGSMTHRVDRARRGNPRVASVCSRAQGDQTRASRRDIIEPAGSWFRNRNKRLSPFYEEHETSRPVIQAIHGPGFSRRPEKTDRY
jgi:hypothetical protein